MPMDADGDHVSGRYDIFDEFSIRFLDRGWLQSIDEKKRSFFFFLCSG